MKTCAQCGNHYDKCFDVITVDKKQYSFDCFECAIHKLAIPCAHCQCKIMGHGLEDNGKIFCCAHCAKLSGVTTLKDRA